ncbi:hypothetical protein DMN91_002200, partial [Ooceraea biroi]|jgi:hypothetical protein
MKVS